MKVLCTILNERKNKKNSLFDSNSPTRGIVFLLITSKVAASTLTTRLGLLCHLHYFCANQT